jgi:hypothetical protein
VSERCNSNVEKIRGSDSYLGEFSAKSFSPPATLGKKVCPERKHDLALLWRFDTKLKRDYKTHPMMQHQLLLPFARALARSSICSRCQRPAISSKKALTTNEGSKVLSISYSGFQTRHASSSTTVDDDKYTPKPLDRLLGFRTPPEAGQNTGIDSRPWRERRDDLFNYDKHLVRRKELYVDWLLSYAVELFSLDTVINSKATQKRQDIEAILSRLE